MGILFQEDCHRTANPAANAYRALPLHYRNAYMKYISQFLIIMGFTMAGEALQRLLPIPVPASVYGLVLLFAALCLGIVKLPQVKTTGNFLSSLLPILFVCPTVGIVENWELIRPQLLPIVLLLAASTILTFGISGGIAQKLMQKGGAKE